VSNNASTASPGVRGVRRRAGAEQACACHGAARTTGGVRRAAVL